MSTDSARRSGAWPYPTYGRMAGFARGDDYVYFAGDATLCYPRQPGRYSRWGIRSLHDVYQQRALPYLVYFVRHILFLREQYFVVYDELKCSQPARYTWLYHIRPDEPLRFDPTQFSVDYAVEDVKIRLQHVFRPVDLTLDDRQGVEGFINPLTGEDYRAWRMRGILCGHNLWISTARLEPEWNFLAVIYPVPPDGTMPVVQRIDDRTVRVGDDIISFDPESPAAARSDFVVDATRRAPSLEKIRLSVWVERSDGISRIGLDPSPSKSQLAEHTQEGSCPWINERWKRLGGVLGHAQLQCLFGSLPSAPPAPRPTSSWWTTSSSTGR